MIIFAEFPQSGAPLSDRCRPNGSWCLSYMLVLHGTRIVESLRQTMHLWGPIDRQAMETARLFDADLSPAAGPRNEKDLKQLESLLERLRNRVNELERGTVEQTGRLSNLTRILESFLESDPALRSRYNNKLTVLKGELVGKGVTSSGASNRDLEAIRFEFEALKKECSLLKSCCDSRTWPDIQHGSGNVQTEEHTMTDRHPHDQHFRRASDVSERELLKLVQNLLLMHHNSRDNERMEKPLGDHILYYLTDTRVREIAKEVLKVYDADKTGRVDYALESAGGLIISTQCTQRYDQKRMAIKVLGFTLYYENNNPRTVIQGHPVQPGTCWAFQGFPGYLLIKLRSFVYVSGFTLEHAPKSILPNEEMKSAPRKFNVWGFASEIDPDPVLFGDYEFANSDESLQYFPVRNTAITRPYEYVELRVHSNHGQLEYTCLYRFRVHGEPV